MDPRLKRYYETELYHLREVGAEFAREFPKIARRLGMEGFECADPYVERLLDGFAFLAARVQLKLDAQFPDFTQHLLELIYPQYLAPTPSMAVVRFEPDMTDADLAGGVTLPRDTAIRSILGKGEQTPCEFRTGQDVTLLPVEITGADYFASPGAIGTLGLQSVPGDARAALRLDLTAAPGLAFEKIALNRLAVYLQGADAVPLRLYEQLLGHTVAVIVRPRRKPAPWQEVLPADSLRPLGFDAGQALVRGDRRSYDGYRLLREYFSFPARFMFVELNDLARAASRCLDGQLEIIVLLGQSERRLEGVLGVDNFQLFCAPAVNLFPKRADRIHLDDHQVEYHVLPDRTRPMDFEVYSVTSVTGYGAAGEKVGAFAPLYASYDRPDVGSEGRFYTIHRRPRTLSTRQQREGGRTSYVGHETYLSLTGQRVGDLRQLAVNVQCTNRDLPLLLSTGFALESGGPIKSISCVSGPSAPLPSNAGGDLLASTAGGDTAWRLISHLSLNYLSLVDEVGGEGAGALRDMLHLYSTSEEHLKAQIDGLRHVASRPIVRPLPIDGPVSFGRGVEVTITCSERAFEGGSMFLFGAVLESFLSRYVSINAFTEMVLRSDVRGEVMRWPARIGRRQVV